MTKLELAEQLNETETTAEEALTALRSGNITLAEGLLSELFEDEEDD